MSACSVFVYDGDTPLDLTKAVIGLEWGDMKGELAARAVLRMNARMGGAELAEYARLNAPISILAYGREVFSGVIWDYSLIDGRTVNMVCYDRLIFLSGSADSAYFPAGLNTRRVLESICRRWDMPLKYDYTGCTHGRLSYRAQSVASQIISTLDAAQTVCGDKYMLRMEGGTLHVGLRSEGKPVCDVSRARLISYTHRRDMSGLVTRVAITTGSSGPVRVREVFDGDTTLGILQEVVDASGATLSDARTQARRLLIERGTPVETIEVACQDEPTLRRGDRITISAGSLAGEYDVLGVMHDRLLSMRMELARHTDGEG